MIEYLLQAGIMLSAAKNMNEYKLYPCSQRGLSPVGENRSTYMKKTFHTIGIINVH